MKPTLLWKAALLGAGARATLLRDDFVGSYAAGAVNGTIATDKANVRAVADSGGQIVTSSLALRQVGRLNIGTGSAVWNDPALSYVASWARGTIGALTAILRLGGTSNTVGPYLNAAQFPAAPGTNGHGLYYLYSDNQWEAFTPSGTVRLWKYTTPRQNIDYMLVVVPRPGGGAYHFISGGQFGTWPTATLLYVGDVGVSTPLYAGAAAYAVGGAFDYLQLTAAADLPAAWTDGWGLALAADTFTRVDGDLNGSTTEVGGKTWQVANGSAAIVSGQVVITAASWGTCVADAGTVPHIIECTVTTPAAGGYAFAVYFRSNADLSSSAYAYFYPTVFLIQVAGTTIYQTACNLSNGTTYKVRVFDFGTHIEVYLDNASMTSNSPRISSALNTQTVCGFGSNNQAHFFDDFVCWPGTVALPVKLGTFPTVPAGIGAATVTDAFTGTDGTRLATHDAAWIDVSDNWEIRSGKAQIITTDTAGVAVREAGTSNHEVSASITLPAYPGVEQEWHCGLVARYVDASNHLFARFIYQGGASEIEAWEYVGGVASGLFFVQLENALLAGTTHILALACQGTEYAVYLDGLLREQGSIAVQGTKVGMMVDITSDGQPTWDDFAVKAT